MVRLLFFLATAVLAGRISAATLVGNEAVLNLVGFAWNETHVFDCRPVTAELAVRFRHCAFEGDAPSFTGATQFYSCIHGDERWRIYRSRERCIDEIETMRANAP